MVLSSDLLYFIIGFRYFLIPNIKIKKKIVLQRFKQNINVKMFNVNLICKSACTKLQNSIYFLVSNIKFTTKFIDLFNFNMLKRTN